ncbi:unnamed protein product [Cuscuta campestris]|uniref:RING-type E3 ubiquitin transferase n=1 Tax=Cuscuta campestris TaxID=132261 RepID=A0A484LNW4_9ASTE|nr:unnamed protein product [Cuscuta campestris]
MGSRRRKLQLTRPDPIPAGEKQCTKFCDPSRNYDGLCPLLCLPLCFSTCKQTLLLPRRPPLLPLPPPPDFAASSAVHTASHFRGPVFLSILAAVAAITFFLVYYAIVKSSAGGGGSRTPPAEEEEEEDGGVERLGDTVVEHPIWYIRTAGLGSSIINRITVCRYERREGLKECCSVCLSEFEGEMVRILPKCHHTFHVNFKEDEISFVQWRDILFSVQ